MTNSPFCVVLRAVFCGTELFCAAWTSLLSARIANLAALCGWGFGGDIVGGGINEGGGVPSFNSNTFSKSKNEGLSSRRL